LGRRGPFIIPPPARSEQMDESDYFWRLVNTPLYWQDTARDFICGANLLKNDYYAHPRLGFARRGRLPPYAVNRQRHTSPRTIIVLYALAIENLLKAIIVARGQDPIGRKGQLEGWFTHHDLNKLAKRAGIRHLNEDLLAQLSEFIKSGKYPVGLSDSDGHRAHNYFPDSVVVGIEGVLPVLEERLDSVPAKRDKLPKIDLLKLCAGRGKRPRAAAKRAGGHA
jgi:hypothetical protein